MSIITVGVADIPVDVEAVSDDRWLVRHGVRGDGRALIEGHIVRYGTVFQLRLSGDRRTRLYAPSFEVSLDYFTACIDGSMGRLCSRDE